MLYKLPLCAFPTTSGSQIFFLLSKEITGKFFLIIMKENNISSTSDTEASRIFEGPEKLLEIWFGPTPDTVPNISSQFDKNDHKKSGLRLVERDVWDEMLDLVKCHVLNVVHNDYFEAYLLR
jgi:hypothetical protein